MELSNLEITLSVIVFCFVVWKFVVWVIKDNKLHENTSDPRIIKDNTTMYYNPVEDLVNELQVYISEHQEKRNDNNRFLINPNIIQDIFPEYDRKTVNQAWLKIKELDLVQQNAIDQAWEVRPRS